MTFSKGIYGMFIYLFIGISVWLLYDNTFFYVVVTELV